MWLKINRTIVIFIYIINNFQLITSTDLQKSTSFVTNSKTHLNILGIFGHPGKSHFDVFKPLLEELAHRGHNLTVISWFPRIEENKIKRPLPNYKDISTVNKKIGIFLDVVDLNNLDHTYTWLLSELGMLKYMAHCACESVLKNPRVEEFIKSDAQFDLIITEAFNTNCFMGFVHKFKAPFISLSSHQIMSWVIRQIDDPQDKSHIPTILFGLKRPLKFFDRMYNYFGTLFVDIAFDYWFHPEAQNIVNQVFGESVPDIRNIAKNTSLVLVNTHYSLQGVRPHLPQVVEIGGLHIPNKIQPLPDDIQRFLDKATEGVLYFNFGSMVKASTLPKEKLDAIMAVIASIPRKVIWKWEIDSWPKKSENIMVKKWLPQFDVLNHPNVKCYMGHGGLLGLSEGIYVGVPMVLIPMYGDQFHNAAAAEARGAAIVLPFDNLNERDLRDALDRVFNDTRYRENAQRVSRAYRDRAASPLETAVWWTEYIGRGNGKPYLRSEGANLSWYQRNLLDVGLFLIVILVLVLYSSYRFIKCLVSSLCTSKKQDVGGETTTRTKNGKLKKQD